MPKKDIGQATSSDMTNVIDNWEVESMDTDGVGNQAETEWQNNEWTTQWGYFNSQPDLYSGITLKATWNVGKSYTADAATIGILDGITGWGKDTFQDIIFNMEIIKRVGGDAYAEIIRNDAGDLLNIKPLPPGDMKIIVNRQGIIKRYEQVAKIKDTNVVTKFEPHEIFHLSNNRLADQIHGISDIKSLQETIDAEAENFDDTKKLMHHQVKPFILWKLKTDDPTKISELVAKIDQARNLGEDMFIPDDDDAIEYEVIQIAPTQAIFTWRDDIRNRFYRTIGLPQIVPGAGGNSTESESKVIIHAFEHIVARDQRAWEAQVWAQLALRVKLNAPESVSPNLQADEAKDAGQQLGFQPSETKV